MTLPSIVLGLLLVLLIASALFDITTYTIPNILTGAMLLLFGLFLSVMALAGHGLSWNMIVPHLTAGGVGLIIGMVMFALHWIGGGDAKLFAMACLWLGWDFMFDYALIASILGGALTLGLLMLRQIPLPAFMVGQPWLVRLTDPKSGVPYGVALAIAALTILPNTEIFRLAMS
jgi:prepilin peptidase CpaA